MLKPFNELFAIDVSSRAGEKPVGGGKKVKFLNWAVCVEMLYENGAESVQYGNIHSKDDHPLFLINGGIPFVKCFVEIDGVRREADYPVINGFFDIEMEKIAQSDVADASQRCFVKCVGTNWGLGLSLWIKEEAEAPLKDNPMSHNIWEIKKRIEELITSLMKKGLSKKEICEAAGINEKQLDQILSYISKISTLEERLRNIKP